MAAQSTTSAVLAGSTGLVGSHILPLLTSLPSTSTHILVRRAPTSPPTSASTSTLTPHISTETSSWPATISALQPSPQILLSALGTTRAAAGGTAGQYAIDHDLNLALAKAAREAGASVYVLISSASASSASRMFYSRMKGELEDDVKALGFRHVVILRPGLLMGARNESRAAESVVQGVARGLRGVMGHKATDFWAQDAGVVAKAAVRAGWACVKGERKEEDGVWELGQADIVKLGTAEWKGEAESQKAE